MLPLALFALFVPPYPTSVNLNVPAVKQKPGSPKEGWCGEASIQMIGLYYGLYAPQTTINRLGHSRTPDLRTQSDLSAALAGLGLRFVAYPSEARNLGTFVQAVEGELDAGVPVLVGMKVYPSAHPDWPNDHFCVVRGYDAGAMSINDTWAFAPERVTWERLGGTTKGISFVNDQRQYVGLAVPEPAGWQGMPMRLVPEDPSAYFQGRSVGLVARAGGLDAGSDYEVVRYDSSAAASRTGGSVVSKFTASAPNLEFIVDAPRDAVSIFRVRAVEKKG